MKNFKLTRRNFLKGSAAVGAASMLPGGMMLSGNAHAAGSGNNVLLVVHLHGGNDHLNTFIPYQDSLYYQYRPTLAQDGGSVIPLDADLALHPAMGRFKTQYDAGRIAIVNGCGYPDFNRSHFRAIDIYDGADPVGYPSTGWMGRYLDQSGNGSSLSGVYVGAAVPLSLHADSVAVPAVPSADYYQYQTNPIPGDGEAQLNAAVDIFNQAATGKAMLDGLLVQDLAALSSVAEVQTAVGGYQSTIGYGDDSLNQNFKLAAQLIHADVGVQVMATELNGFDTHANQLGTHANLLDNVSSAIDNFLQDAEAGGFANRVTVLLFSEFGRRVAENGSGGTDHGTAAPMIIAGHAVQGGIYNAPPNLSDLDGNGDLKLTMDFRSVYATLLEDWLKVDSAPILGGSWATLPLFA